MRWSFCFAWAATSNRAIAFRKTSLLLECDLSASSSKVSLSSGETTKLRRTSALAFALPSSFTVTLTGLGSICVFYVHSTQKVHRFYIGANEKTVWRSIRMAVKVDHV